MIRSIPASLLTLCITVILLIAFSPHAKAQFVQYYPFTASSGSYSAISTTSSTLIDAGSSMNEGRYSITLPFTYYFNNVAYSTARIHTNGYIALGSVDPGSGQYYGISNTNTGFPVIAGMSTNLAGSTKYSSRLHTIVQGSAPNRTFVIEWKDFGYSGDTELNVNFQIQLSETTNDITIVYGSCSLMAGSLSRAVQVGLRGTSNTIFNHRDVGATTSWSATNAATSNNDALIFIAGGGPNYGQTYEWSTPYCVVPGASTGLVLTPSFNSVSGTFSGSAHKYLVVRTPGGTPLNTTPVNGTAYALNATLGNGTVVHAGAAAAFTSTGLPYNTSYTYTVFPYNDVNCINAPLYRTTTPLSGTTLTLRPRTYTWLPNTGSAVFTTASNWNPSRINPHPEDTLIFDNGGNDTAINMLTHTIGIVRVVNNTDLTLRPLSIATQTVDQLIQVDTGSSLTLMGAVTLQFGAAAPVKAGTFHGLLNLINGGSFKSANANVVFNTGLNIRNASVYTSNAGTSIFNVPVNQYNTSSFLAQGGTNIFNKRLNLADSATIDLSTAPNTQFNDTVNCFGSGAAMKSSSSTFSTAIFNPGSVYNHMRDSGSLPPARFAATSLINITGIISKGIAGNNYVDPGNIIWNCPGQTASVPFNTLIDTVQGSFTIVTANSQTIRFTGNSPNYFMGDFVQNLSTVRVNGSWPLKFLGTARLNSGIMQIQSSPAAAAVSFRGDLIQSSSHTIVNGLAATAIVRFDGTSAQNINIGGTLTPGAFEWVLDNPSGAVLTGTIPVSNNDTNTIKSGNWTGPGTFTYSGTTTLYYNTVASQPSTIVEWPATNGPLNLVLECANPYPANRVLMSASRNITGQVVIKNGVLVLGNNDLKVDGAISTALSSGQAFDSTHMVAAEGTGFLIKKIPTITSSTRYELPVGNVSGTPRYSGVELTFLSNTAARYIGVRVKPVKHPADASLTNYLNRYWTFSDDGGTAAYSYRALFNHPYSDIVGAGNYSLNRWNGTSWLQLPSTVFTGVTACELEMLDTTYSSAQPLNGSDFAGRTRSSGIYSWTGAQSTDWRNALNWTPARNTPDPSDILQFNSGNADTARNIPNQAIGRLLVTNNTIACLQAAAVSLSSTNQLSIYSDYDTTTNELQVDSGSALVSNGSARPLLIALTGDKCRGLIAGRAEIAGINGGVSFNTIRFDCKECVTRVSSSGLLAAGEWSSATNAGFISSDTSVLVISGLYEHRFIAYPGQFPIATWLPGSLALINGYAGSSAMANLSNQRFYDLTYNCPNQVSNGSFQAASTLSVSHIFRMISTGTGSFGGNIGFSATISRYLQTGGRMNLTHASGTTDFNVADSFMQTGGTFVNTGTLPVNLHFNGNGGQQEVSFKDAAPTGPWNYRVSNPAGIHLVGTGTLTSVFDVNTNGGMQISVPLNSPISSTLHLKYIGNTTLRFDGIGSIAPDTLVYPALDAPSALTVNIGGGNMLTMPGSRDIGGFLQMDAGDIYLGAGNMTIGVSPSSAGGIRYTSGLIHVTTGVLTRWYGTTGLPTTPSISSTLPSIGYYPLAVNGYNRTLSLYFSTATGITSGGTFAVKHTNIAGLTSGLSVADGASYTIRTRSSSYWDINAGNGLAMSIATIGMRLTTGGLAPVSNPFNLRLMKAASVAGIHVSGTGISPDYFVQRTALNFSDVNGNSFYVGVDSTNITTGAFISVTDGSWNTASTWNRNAIPGSGDTVIISAGDTVSVSAASTAAIVNLDPLGTLNITGSTLTVGAAISNYGTFALNGGTVNLGPAGGGLCPFEVNPGATLNVTAGTLTVNGSMRFGNTRSTKFYQSGGAIIIDGNANGVVANSVLGDILDLRSASLFLTGGTITIVDPPSFPAPGPSSALNIDGNAGNVITTGHTLIFGDGISTTAGGNTQGFFIRDPSFGLQLTPFGQVLINGSSSGNNRFVTITPGFAIKGDLIITGATGKFVAPGIVDSLYLGGNLSVGAGAVFQSLATTIFRSNANATPVPQLVSGAGTFNDGASSTFARITVDNASAGGVTFNIGDVKVSGFINFLKGRLNIANNATLNLQTSSVIGAGQSTGWVVGRCQRNLTIGTNRSTLIPIGDAGYAPVTLIASYSVPLPFPSTAFFRAAVASTDHPNIAGSGINASRSVNRYYTLDTFTTFVATGVELVFEWQPGDMDAATSWTNLTAARYRSSAWSGNPVVYPAPTSIRFPIPGIDLAGAYQVGEPGSSPLITSQPVNDTVCTGQTANFSVASTTATGYQWQENTGSTWVDISAASGYGGATTANLVIASPATTMNGYQYRCKIYNSYDTTISAAATLVINSSITPSVSISANMATTVCAGQIVRFTASSVNGGTAPVYQWKVNGINASVYTSIFNWSVNGPDVITCTLTSSIGCASPASVTSASISMAVIPLLTPSVSISVSPVLPACPSSTLVFTATPVNGGTTPVYQWHVNGANAGTNSNVFSSGALAANDTVRCLITSNATCLVRPTDSSSDIVVTFVAAPAQPGTMTGATSICGTTVQTYSVPPVAGASSYTWTLPSGWTGSSTTNSISVTPTGTGGTISVTATNNCATSAARTLSVTTGTAPSTPSAISGNAVACTGVSQTYSVTPDPNASSYIWTLPSGWTGTSSTNSITVTTTSTGGTVSVVATSSCGNSSASTLVVTTATTPGTPGAISGNTPVCSGTLQTYSVTAVSGATSYNWTLPSGWTGSSTTNSISATPGTTGGTISVTSSNTCGTSAAATKSVTATTTPAQPASIFGTTTACSGISHLYSVTNDPTVTAYTWTLPSGWTGSSTTNSIGAVATATGGTISITLGNACGTSAPRTLAVTSTTVPAQPSTIGGSTAVCSGVSQIYSVTNDPNVTTYTWTVPSGWTGSSSSNSLTTTPGTTSGNVTVTGTNYCGTSSVRTLAVTVTPTPGQPSTITGPTAACVGISQTYSVTAVTGVTSYTWTLPSGWTGTSTTNTINATPGATGGTISVTATNSCGTSTARTLTVTTTVVPGQPGSITGATAICSGTTQLYSVAAVSGASSYVWTLPSGWSGSSSTTSISSTAGTSSGTVSVAASNACGSSTASTVTVTVTTPPAQPGTITGSATPCQNTTQAYGVSAVTGALSYTWTYPVGWTGSSSTNSISLGTNSASGSVSVTANNTCGSSTPQTLSISTIPLPAQPSAISGSASICAGTTQVYSVSSVTGATSYAWTIPSGWSGTSTSTSISVTAGSTGGTVGVAAVNSCGTSAASTLSVTITAAVVPTVSISASPGSTICVGTSVTFSGTTTNGGSTPGYVWKRNGVSVGTGVTLTTSGLANGDSITLTLTSSAGCASPLSVTSPAIYMTVIPAVLPIVTITTPIPPVNCAGVPLTLNTSITNGGAAPGYQWYKNSSSIGAATSSSLTVTPIVGTDTFTVALTSNAQCASPLTVTSNKAVVKGIANVIPTISLNASPGTNVPKGSTVQFTASWTNAGLDSAVVWIKNGVVIPGIVGKTYTEVNAQNGDTISVELTNKDGCATPATVRTGLRLKTPTSVSGLNYPGAVNLMLVPNPTDGQFAVQAEWGSEHIGERVTIEVLNALGQVVYSTEVKPGTTKWTMSVYLRERVADGLYQVSIKSPTFRVVRPLQLRR